jgi:hypothetical protein
MLLASRLAGLSAFEAHYAGVNGRTQSRLRLAHEAGDDFDTFNGPIFGFHAPSGLRQQLAVDRLAPDVDAGGARLRAVGERLTQIGQLRVVVKFELPTFLTCSYYVGAH